MRITFILVLFSILCCSCKVSKMHFEAPVLELKNEQINSLIDSFGLYSLECDKKGYIAQSEQKISVIQVEKSNDTIKIRLRGLSSSFMFNDDMFFLKQHLYGVYEYRGTAVFIFGNNASLLFDKTKQNTTISYLVSKEEIYSEYTTGWHDYYIVNGQIYFDKIIYAL